MVAGHRGRDARQQGRPRRCDQLSHRRRWLTDVEGARPVAVPAIDDGARVDRYDLAVADHALARDAMDDLIVDGDAQAGREGSTRIDARIALEGRRRTRRPDVGFSQTVQVPGGNARLELFLDQGKDLRDDPAGTAHPLDLSP